MTNFCRHWRLPQVMAMGFSLLVTLPTILALDGCSGKGPTRVIDILPDTSWLKVFDVKYLAVNDSAEYNSGLELYWREYFYSNYSKSCRILQYVVLDPHEDTILHKQPQSLIIASGDTNYAKSKWIDVADPSVAGIYALHISYRHSSKDFSFDTTIDVIANMLGHSGQETFSLPTTDLPPGSR